MKNSLRTDGSKIISIVSICFVIFLSWPASAQQPNDYFVTPKDDMTLSTVEKYHLGQDNFWRKYKNGEFQHARMDLDFVLRYFPNHPQALMLMGSLAKLIKSTSLVIPYYEKALQLYPQHAVTPAQYGAYLADIGRVDTGIAKLKEAIEIDPKLAAAYVWLAAAYSKNGNPELANQAMEQAKALGYKGEIRPQGSRE